MTANEAAAPDVAALRAAAEAATPTERLTVMRYDHGGGRVAIMDGNERHLVADYYDEANREYYVAANPRTLLAVLDRLAAVEAKSQELATALYQASWNNASLRRQVAAADAECDAARQQLAAAEARERALRASCQELVDAMVAYQMSVDESPPYKHRQMMQRAAAALADASAPAGRAADAEGGGA